jgi:hypothetical protein
VHHPRRLAVVVAATFTALALATPTALADGGGRYRDPDPTTCASGLFSLVKIRTSEDGTRTRVTVAEREDAHAQAVLHTAEHNSRNAHAVEAATLAKWNRTRDELTAVNAESPHDDAWATRHANAVVVERSARQAYLDAHADTARTDAALAEARHNAERKRSYLAEIRLDLSHHHDDVLRITALVDHLCSGQQQPPTTDEPPVTEPPVTGVPTPTTDAPAPPVPVEPTPAGSAQVGQTPEGSVLTGGGALATAE